MELQQQITDHYGFADFEIEHLDIPVNDVIKITTPSQQYALKLYNTKSRSRDEVQWELDLVLHLVEHGVPVVTPIESKNGFIVDVTLHNQQRVGILSEWAPGSKPEPVLKTYELLGGLAAKIHAAGDKYEQKVGRDDYNATVLIDEQLHRMKPLLKAAGEWDTMQELCARLHKHIASPALDYGICHMDLTLDNIHQHGNLLTVFDFDSAGTSWRALEPHGVLRASEKKFQKWLEGYRKVRQFSDEDEKAVYAFAIIGNLRVVAWQLGVAKSSRGTPLMTVDEIPKTVGEWLRWEETYL